MTSLPTINSNRKIKILLVEDNPGDVRLIKEMLKSDSTPFEMDAVGRLSAAFDRINNDRYDIMLLDLGLPDSQGLETMDRARQLAADIPIIILTGLADEKIGIQAVERGAQDFLIKWEASEAILSRTITYAIERKRLEVNLRDSESQYRELFDNMMNPSSLHELILDDQGEPVDSRILDVNKVYEEMVGQKRENIIGKTIKEVFPKIDDSWIATCAEVALTGKPAHFQDYSKDLGKTFETSVYCPRKCQFAIVRKDITEQIITAQALRESEERLEMAVTGADLGLWDWDVISSQIILNDKGVEIMGNPPEGLRSDAKTFGATMHPEDREVAVRKVEAHFNGQTPFIELECRVRMKNGQWRWIQANGRVVERDTQGKPLRAAGILKDVSELVLAHEALHQSERRYRNIVETAGEGIWMIDNDHKTVFVNQQMADMLGYKAEEMIGRPILEFMDDEAKQLAIEHLDRRRMGIKEQFDFRYRRKDGTDFWAIVSTTPLVDDQSGAYRGSLKMIADFNDRKKSEIREKARFALLNRLRSAKTIDECLQVGCKAISDSNLYRRAAIIFYDAEGNIINSGHVGLDKSEAAAVKRGPAPEKSLFDKLTQSKFRISKSYFIGQDLSPFKTGAFPNISSDSGRERESYWNPGEMLIMPIVQQTNGDKYDGLVSVAAPYSPQHPPLHEQILRLEEIIDMLTIRARELRHAEALAQERQALAEKNVALKEIMSVVEAEKMEIRQQIAGMIDQVLKPAVNRLVRRDGMVNKTYFDLLKYNLDELAVATGGALHMSSKLSPREMEICSMIKNGSSSKDIAEALDIALVTVQKHREVIRKKLGLTNKNINLTTHLRNM